MFLSKVFKRHFCNIGTRNTLEPLKTRTILQVEGNEAHDFLQGLITNDMNHLSKNTGGSMFTMFLNTKGRVLYDALVYKIANGTFLIECDLEIEKSLLKHMQLYRVRRKIDISSAGNNYRIHVLFNKTNSEKVLEKDDSESVLNNSKGSMMLHKNLIIFKDPRINELGYRVISSRNVDVEKEIREITRADSHNSINSYRLLRYSLGVGEGKNDLPVGSCFPLECNCDYLHGVSFHKGCYIGQELTARTHHTGVVRKRLMPLFFKNPPSALLNTDNIVIGKSTLGKLRGVEGNLGLALLRIDLALELKEFEVENEIATVSKPHWWPVTLPKEKHFQKT